MHVHDADADADGLAQAAAGTALDGAAYMADVGDALEPFLLRAGRLRQGAATPFHSPAWLRAWYGTLGRAPGRHAVLVSVRRCGGGGADGDVMLLPLVSRRAGGLSIVEFADASVVDYNLPLLAAAPPAAAGASGADEPQRRQRDHAIWRAVRQALAGHDVLLINKMPAATLDNAAPVANPLMAALRTRPCALFGNQFHVPGSWDDWRRTLDGRVRRELERSWRVFTRSPQARFERITELPLALQLFGQLEALQAEHLHQRRVGYVLDQPVYGAFYRRALEGGLADGSVVLTALRDGAQLVAVQLGVADGGRYVALRMATGGAAFSACSPGRLLCERTAQHLHGQGLRWFDFGIGRYAHKEVFQVQHMALFEACEALSWRGRVYALGWHLRHWLRRQAWALAMARSARRARV